jgi:hypothetical protein
VAIRVVQWTTGKTGAAAVRAMVGHPLFELVGCYAYGADKDGVDVGTLCGLAPLGVRATRDVDALLALRPDCVSYMPFRPDVDHVVRILESGANVVTTLHMLSGRGYGEAARARIEAAALGGGSSLYASGVYPGHAPMVALAASAMCARIDELSVLESLDMSGYRNEAMFRAMGIDLSPDDPRARASVEAACGPFRDQLENLAIALAVPLDEIRLEVELAIARETHEVGGMTIRRGHVAGMSGAVAGVVDGAPRLRCRFVWKMGEAIEPNWPVVHGVVIEIRGEPSLRCKLEPLAEPFDGALTTALPVVNAIPRVVAARPGIVNRSELPLTCGTHRVTRAPRPQAPERATAGSKAPRPIGRLAEFWRLRGARADHQRAVAHPWRRFRRAVRLAQQTGRARRLGLGHRDLVRRFRPGSRSRSRTPRADRSARTRDPRGCGDLERGCDSARETCTGWRAPRDARSASVGAICRAHTRSSG